MDRIARNLRVRRRLHQSAYNKPNWDLHCCSSTNLRKKTQNSFLIGVTHAQQVSASFTQSINQFICREISHKQDYTKYSEPGQHKKLLVQETFKHSRPIKLHNFCHFHQCKFLVCFLSLCHPYYAASCSKDTAQKQPYNLMYSKYSTV